MNKIKYLLLGTMTMVGTSCADVIQEKERTLARLELLLEHTKGLDLPDSVSRDILKAIGFELAYAKRKLIEELGKKAYEERKK